MHLLYLSRLRCRRALLPNLRDIFFLRSPHPYLPPLESSLSCSKKVSLRYPTISPRRKTRARRRVEALSPSLPLVFHRLDSCAHASCKTGEAGRQGHISPTPTPPPLRMISSLLAPPRRDREEGKKESGKLAYLRIAVMGER